MPFYAFLWRNNRSCVLSPVANVISVLSNVVARKCVLLPKPIRMKIEKLKKSLPKKDFFIFKANLQPETPQPSI